jgi:cytochrome bd ubiquinol oxidase subunit I
MDFDPVFFSRLQFAWVIGWHILLPAFTVGLAAYIALLEGLNFVTGRQVYLRVSMFWIKVFSISFGTIVAGPRMSSRARWTRRCMM